MGEVVRRFTAWLSDADPEAKAAYLLDKRNTGEGA
jgi:hypothetical protein